MFSNNLKPLQPVEIMQVRGYLLLVFLGMMGLGSGTFQVIMSFADPSVEPITLPAPENPFNYTLENCDRFTME